MRGKGCSLGQSPTVAFTKYAVRLLNHRGNWPSDLKSALQLQESYGNMF
jgi:hypothetical protein